MDLVRYRWPHLDALVDLARAHHLGAWLFGSALRTSHPADIDVLLVYVDRRDVVTIRNADWWSDYDPPLDIIAMTVDEEAHYDFIRGCGAVSLTRPATLDK